MNRNNKGFTLAELLIVVAILSVLVAVSIPIFSGHLEKSRESVDFSNVRSAYSEVMMAVMTEDTGSPLHKSDGYYLKTVPLKQAQKGWTTDISKINIGGITANSGYWLRAPEAGGTCKVYYRDNHAYIDWGGKEGYINQTSAADFLTKAILEIIVGSDYKYNVINSNEPYHQGEGTMLFTDYAKANGFDLAEDYGATTWQIYVKENGNKSTPVLQNPAIYWSTVAVDSSNVGKYVPVIGYRDGKYDVYIAKVDQYNIGTDNEYYSLHNGFANITDGDDGLGGKATFQYDNYEQAKAEYDKLLKIYEDKKTLTSSDLSDDVKK